VLRKPTKTDLLLFLGILVDKKHGIGWAGDSNIPKALGVAVGELIKLADGIQKSRSK
jgi:hypothetical protein